MRIVGDITVALPFPLDYCAKGPDVDPIVFERSGTTITVFFPPSMSDGTVGQNFYPSGWAWWTGTTLRITLSQPLTGPEIDVDVVRDEFVMATNRAVRKLLNAYRTQFHRPEITPVPIESKNLILTIEYPDGSSELLPEPFEEFFYRKIPDQAPLDRSINATTLQQLSESLASDIEPSINEQLLLDAERLENLGEQERAAVIRELADRVL